MGLYLSYNEEMNEVWYHRRDLQCSGLFPETIRGIKSMGCHQISAEEADAIWPHGHALHNNWTIDE